jgi:hypothetical protein
MVQLPTYAWLILFAIVAFGAGRVLGGSPREEPESLPRFILYAIGIGCVIIAAATYWLGRAS